MLISGWCIDTQSDKFTPFINPHQSSGPRYHIHKIKEVQGSLSNAQLLIPNLQYKPARGRAQVHTATKINHAFMSKDDIHCIQLATPDFQYTWTLMHVRSIRPFQTLHLHPLNIFVCPMPHHLINCMYSSTKSHDHCTRQRTKSFARRAVRRH